MTTSLRADRVPFRFSGPDAQKLLNDVLTSRIVAEGGAARWWALLSPQGKVQAEGLIGWADGAFWLDVHRDVADAFFKRMRMYKLRANVTMEDLRETHVVGWTAAGPEGSVADLDPRGIDLGWRIIASGEAATGWRDDDIAWHWARISGGIAEMGAEFATDVVFPHDIGMDLLGGVDFTKGCYVGQEVVSRMQHRGTARRRPVIVSGLPADAAPGMPILVGEREAGSIGPPVNGEAVAIVRLDRFDGSAEPTVGGLPVELNLRRWATYKFGEAAEEGV